MTANKHISVEYNSGFFKNESFSKLVRCRLSKEALNPGRTIECYVTVRFKGVDGYVCVDFLELKEWSYMQETGQEYKTALTYGKCREKHAKAAIEYVLGKKFRSKFFRTKAACYGGYHMYA